MKISKIVIGNKQFEVEPSMKEYFKFPIETKGNEDFLGKLIDSGEYKEMILSDGTRMNVKVIDFTLHEIIVKSDKKIEVTKTLLNYLN